MAWAQRSNAAGFGSGREPYFIRDSHGDLERASSCAECTSLIAGEAVVVNREGYCSVDCAREAMQAKNVPGHYLG